MTTEAKNRELLLLFFEPDEMPDPAKKEEFLKNVMAGQLSRTARITLDRMLLIQVKYIRKTAWLAALMILLAAALITKGNPGISLLIRKYIAISAMLTLSCLLLPFLLTMTGALLLERTAFGRSHPYGSGVLALLIAAGTEILLLPAGPLAMPLNKTLIMQDYAWVLEIATVLMLVTVIALFCTNVKQEAEMTTLWN